MVTVLASCTTLENRRDMYCGDRKVMGPYTKMLRDGIPTPDQPEIPASASFKSGK